MKINLLSYRGVFKVDDNFNLKLSMIAIITLFFILVWHFILVKKISNNLSEIDELDRKIIEFDKIQESAIKRNESLVLQKFSELRSGRINFLKRLNSIYQGVVGSVCLKQVSIDKNDAVFVVGNSQSVASLRSFIENLSSQKSGDGLTIKKMKKHEDGYQFMLM